MEATLAKCLAYSPLNVSIYAASDIIIFISCCAISVAILLYINSKQPEFKISGYVTAGIVFWVGLLFLGSFLSLWYPIHLIVGIMKAITAMTALITAIAMFPLLPRFLEILTPQEYEAVIQQLYDSNKDMESQVRTAKSESRKVTRELTRRVRGILATIHGISKETARSAPDIKTYLTKFNSRIVGLTHCNDLLLSNGWKGADIKDVIRTQLEQFAELAKGVTIEGPELYLNPFAVHQISSAVHELAANSHTNSNSNFPSITWRQHEDEHNEDNSTFTLLWDETVPKGIAEPIHKGFGHVVLNYSVPTALNGLSELRFTDQKVQWELEAPITSLR